MSLIKNYPLLASSDERKIILNLIEAGLESVQIENVLSRNFTLRDSVLTVTDKQYNLHDYDRITLIAFGKGSAAIAHLVKSTLGAKLTRQFVIDVAKDGYDGGGFTLGTHPLPSAENMNFSKNVLAQCKNMTDRDLVLVVICGGGSVMFDVPFAIDLEKLIAVNDALLDSGADIIEVNTIRKHLSITKGGGLAKLLRPAKIVSLIFSDVPGNDLSFIASGPTVKDDTTVEAAKAIFEKLNLTALGIDDKDFCETPKEDEIFAKVDNILMLSNLTALNAMRTEAYRWGINAEIYSEKFQADAHEAGKILIENTKPGSILLAGGETTVRVNNPDGKGGRNQALVLSSLDRLGEDTIIASVASDGWDNSPAAGALGDSETVQKAKALHIDAIDFEESDNSFIFFNNTEDAIITDRLPSNVADLVVVYKK